MDLDPRCAKVPSLSLTKLLPFGRASPFHNGFLHYCIAHDLPSLMVLYVQHYGLAQTLPALQELALDHAQRPWVRSSRETPGTEWMAERSSCWSPGPLSSTHCRIFNT